MMTVLYIELEQAMFRQLLKRSIMILHGALTYRLNMSEIISTSVSAAAIFSAEEILGAAPKKDMMELNKRR